MSLFCFGKIFFQDEERLSSIKGFLYRINSIVFFLSSLLIFLLRSIYARKKRGIK